MIETVGDTAYGWTTPPVDIPLEGVSSEGVGTFTLPEPQIMKSIEELRRLLRTRQRSGYQKTEERVEGRVDQLRTDVQATFDGLAERGQGNLWCHQAGDVQRFRAGVEASPGASFVAARTPLG